MSPVSGAAWASGTPARTCSARCSSTPPAPASASVDLAATQFASGGAFHQYQPLTKTGNDAIGSGFNDDPLWLVLGVAAYLKETGDATILNEQVPFSDGGEATLYGHLERSLRYTLDRLGPHGLPLIGRADWNDCLNLNCFSETPGESFQTTENLSGRRRRVDLHRRAVHPRRPRVRRHRRPLGRPATRAATAPTPRR